MKKWLLFIVVLWVNALLAQDSREFAVEVSAQVSPAQKSIILKWKRDSVNDGSVSIYRKKKNDLSWGSVYKKVNAGTYTFTDTAIKIGEGYEYYLKKIVGSATGVGYIYAGMEMPLVENRGMVLLLVESGIYTGILDKLNRYIFDLKMDGWKVQTIQVSASERVDSVKKKIKDIYAIYAKELKTVCIIGHVPVPYSGLLNPDAHPDHKGAWPSDGYYGDVFDDVDYWSDIVIKDTISASRKANRNWSNDGKFDESVFPSDIELQVGRIDMFDMPAFGKTEVELLNLYFDKNHSFRVKKMHPVMKGVIDDNFKGVPEAFAANGWRNFSVLLDTTNYMEGDYINTLDTLPCIWSYGCGGGWYTSASGIGTTDDFAKSRNQGVFTMLFGSYFGDWDNTNNLLRAPLASPLSSVLTNAWAGRPWWQFHHMGLGENIGYSTLISQNNQTTYSNIYNFAAGMVHTALMGDPTLRMHIIDPIDTVYVSQTHGGAFNQLSWSVSQDSVDGYYIYRSAMADGIFNRISSTPVKDTFYIDNRPLKGENYYIVKACRLEKTPSGTYYNQSLGSATGKIQNDSVDYQGIGISQEWQTGYYPNPNNGHFRIVIPEQEMITTVTLFDLQGKVIYATLIPAHQSFKEVDCSEMADGVYILSLVSGEKQSTKRLIITH